MPVARRDGIDPQDECIERRQSGLRRTTGEAADGLEGHVRAGIRQQRHQLRAGLAPVQPFAQGPDGLHPHQVTGVGERPGEGGPHLIERALPDGQHGQAAHLRVLVGQRVRDHVVGGSPRTDQSRQGEPAHLRALLAVPPPIAGQLRERGQHGRGRRMLRLRANQVLQRARPAEDDGMGQPPHGDGAASGQPRYQVLEQQVVDLPHLIGIPVREPAQRLEHRAADLRLPLVRQVVHQREHGPAGLAAGNGLGDGVDGLGPDIGVRALQHGSDVHQNRGILLAPQRAHGDPLHLRVGPGDALQQREVRGGVLRTGVLGLEDAVQYLLAPGEQPQIPRIPSPVAPHGEDAAKGSRAGEDSPSPEASL